jgi:hypothetical protein
MSLRRAPESLFWYWVNERHAIYLRRTAGYPKPWTVDPILRDYKFTNVFRQLDAGTVWLTENFIKPHFDDDPALLAFNIAWYRMFNWVGTGELLGWRTRWDPKAVKRILRREQDAGGQVFTGAHIVWGEFGLTKIDGVVDCCTEIHRRRKEIVATSRFMRSLRSTFDVLTQVRGVGGFMAYEIVSDLRHTRILSDARDINRWANVGPGAMRGLRRLNPKVTPAEALPAMRDLLQRSLDESEHSMELRDIEHSLCEFDKYCRVKYREGRPRSKYNGRAE